MHGYTVYGFLIASDVLLPELIPSSLQNGIESSAIQLTATVRIGRIDLSRRSPSDAGVVVWATADDVCLHYEDVATYHITRGQDICIEPAEGSEDSLVRLFLLGPVLAVLLHQRKWLVLHASGVSIAGAAAVFVAEKGHGKSTLAAALHARGHPLIADDLIPVDFTDSKQPSVQPGFPQIKIAPATAARLGHGPDDLSLLHVSMPKRALRTVEDFAQSAVPLRRIFVLGTGEREAVKPLAPQQRFVELVRHSYLAPLLKSTGEAAAHFSQVVALASGVGVMELQRRWELGDLERVAKLVETEMEQAANDQQGAPPEQC